MTHKTIKDVMIPHPVFIDTCTTLQQAAKAMQDADRAILHVGSPDNLEGVITDRDLVIRAIINGQHKGKPVSDYMEQQIVFCDEDDTLEHACDIMMQHKRNRLIVRDSQGNVTGIVSMTAVLEHNNIQSDSAIQA